MKGGNLDSGSLPTWGVFAGVFALGLVLGGVAIWMYVARTRAEKPITVAAPPTVVVVPPSSVTNSKMPVYPDKDPEYPLRALAPSAEFQQVGILKSIDGSEPIVLPLFGRRLPNRPDRWEYYTATDKQNMLRVPIVFENRDCLEEVGCNEVYKGDTIEVPVYNKQFEVQLYKYRTQ